MPDPVPRAAVSQHAVVGDQVAIGAFAVVHDGVEIAAGCAIGSGAVLHPGTVLGEGCVVEDGAVLGKRPRLRLGSRASGRELDGLRLGEGVMVCCGAVLYAGSEVGPGTILGDGCQVRERVRIGAGTVVGRGSTVDFDSSVGDRVRIQTDVYLTAGSLVEDDVFLGPGVVSTNDDTMGRHPRSDPLRGPVLRRACRVGGGAVLVPGVEIGPEAFVAAGAVVIRDVAERDVVIGVPARVVRQVADEELLERWR